MQMALNPFGGGGEQEEDDGMERPAEPDDPSVRKIDATSNTGLAEITATLGIPVKKRTPQAP